METFGLETIVATGARHHDACRQGDVSDDGRICRVERAMIQERVRAGLARARSEGKRLGRPPIAPALEKRIREALATPGRPGIRVIAERGSASIHRQCSASAALSTAQAS